MATALTIATVDKLSLMQPEWEIVETLNGRNTFTFRILSLDGSYRPAGGAVVEFEHGSIEFNGTIHSVDEEGLGGLGVTPIISTVHCVDYNELPDRRQVEVTIPGGSTLKQALQQLVEYLSDYGVTLWVSQVNGPTFAEDVVFQMGTLTGCFDKLALMSSSLGTSYAWDIGYDKVLRMFEVGTDAAPTPLPGNDFVVDDIKVTPVDMSAYANVVRVRFTSEAVSAWAFLEATGTFSNTETITVAKTYTLQTVLTNTDGNVLIGASAAATLANLVAAITLGAGAGTTYAAATTANPSVTASVQSATLMRVRALTAGAGGNAIACTETAANAAWITEGGGAVATLQFGADEALSQSVTATTSPAAADVRERTYDHPEVQHQETAQALADGYLTRDSVLPKTTRYRANHNAAGTHPGQTQTFVQPKRNLSSTHLITEVRITPEGSLVWYDITMVSTSTVAPAHPLEMYRHWGRGGSGSGSGQQTATTTAAAGVSASLGGAVNTIPYNVAASRLGTSSGMTFDGSVFSLASGRYHALRGLSSTLAATRYAGAHPALFQAAAATDFGPVIVAFGAHAFAAWQEIVKSRSTDGSTLAIVQNNDEVARWNFAVDDGTDWQSHVARIVVEVDGVAAANDTPGRIRVYTTPAGSPTPLERFAINKAGLAKFFYATEQAGAVLQTGVISPTQLVANTDNWNPTGLATANVIRMDVNGALNLTGIVAQTSGTILTLYNKTAYTVTLTHDATSTAANRFYCPGATNYALLQKASVRLRYDGTDSRWTVQ
jgi:hypothetical protein